MHAKYVTAWKPSLTNHPTKDREELPRTPDIRHQQSQKEIRLLIVDVLWKELSLIVS
jgi:hypothetical protein